ncbi:MAG: ABC transporter ATP-binding protein [Agriterribacter sp.]
MADSLLSINNLSVDFVTDTSVTHALNNISFEVNKGEIVAVVGESGSGKSVTSLSILQLMASPPAVYTQGEIIFYSNNKISENVLQLPDVSLRNIRGNKISMIFQEPMTSLNPLFSCGNQVMEVILLHQKLTAKEARKKVVELFSKVQLPEPDKIFDRFPHEISGGQKQRVMIAMAISCEPELLIADEPTTALDVTVQKSVLQLIRQLQLEKNISVIFITHDLGLVAEIADRVVVMYKGNIVEQGKVTAIFSNPQHPYTKALLACRPSLHAKGERLPVVSDFMELNNEGVIVEKKDADALYIKQHSLQLPAKNISHTSDIPLLQVKNISVIFPHKKKLFARSQQYTKAVSDVSFEIYKRETVGLVGESGCGKTTLGRSILRLLEPTTGDVMFNGKNLRTLTDAEMRSERKHMQIIFQDPYSSLNPRLTVGNTIAEAMMVHSIGKDAAERREMIGEILKKVDLKPKQYDNYPHEFSGGQRQRVGIARALALNPSFIICDESVSALDVSVQAQVLNLLNDLKAEYGFCMLFISHDLSVVRYISDRVLVMHKGIIVEAGRTEEIYNNPLQDYTKKLIAASPK